MNTRLQCVPIIQVCPALTAGAPGESGCADICLFSIPRFLLPKLLRLAGPMSRGDPHNRCAIPPVGPLQDPRVHQEVEPAAIQQQPQVASRHPLGRGRLWSSI